MFANTFNRYLVMTSDPVVDSLVERLQELYSTHHANGNLALAKYESCSMYWYLCSKTLDAYQLNRIIVAEAPLIRQSGFGIRPKYIVENNWNFEELTYAQFKQRAVEALISDQVDQDDGTAAIGLSNDVEISSQLEALLRCFSVSLSSTIAITPMIGSSSGHSTLLQVDSTLCYGFDP